MTEVLLQKLIEFVEGVSPVVWATLLKQVYIEAIVNFVWGIVLMIVCAALYKIGRHCLNQKSHESSDLKRDMDWDMGAILAWVFAVFSGVISPFLITTAIKYILNPEFYAIRFLLDR